MRGSLFYQTGCSLWRRQRRPNAKPHCRIIPSASFSTADHDEGDAFQSNPSKVKIFDRHLKRKQRDRAAWLLRPNDSFIHAVAENLVDRLEPFALATAGLISVPIDLPGTTFNRAVKAGRQIRQQLFALITKKKNEILEKRKTVASDLVDSMLMDGMTEVEIGNKIVGFFIASHDTTSTAITFLVSYLSDHPDVYNRVLQEQMEVIRGKEGRETLRWEDIQRMKYTWCVACEVMRLAPPANGSFREAITDFTYAGFTIPKGWKAFWTVHTTNKNPKYFPDPERFDPSRFEGDGPAPYTFVPFGGGPRMCPGKEYARLEILTFIHNLVTSYNWVKMNPNEKISYIPSPIPEEGLPIKIEAILN
ncbi:hypothetical protein V6N13_031816 [Hibiscus sabdariffa]